MAGKGSKNRTNPHSPEWSESYDRIFGEDVIVTQRTINGTCWILDNTHPKGSCGGYCDQCEGGCDE